MYQREHPSARFGRLVRYVLRQAEPLNRVHHMSNLRA